MHPLCGDYRQAARRSLPYPWFGLGPKEPGRSQPRIDFKTLRCLVASPPPRSERGHRRVSNWWPSNSKGIELRGETGAFDAVAGSGAEVAAGKPILNLHSRAISTNRTHCSHTYVGLNRRHRGGLAAGLPASGLGLQMCIGASVFGSGRTVFAIFAVAERFDMASGLAETIA